MTTTEELKERVDRISDVQDRFARNFTILTELVVNQRQEMAELRQQTTELRQQTTELQLQTAELLKISAATQKRLDGHDAQLAELQQQTAELRKQTTEIRQQTVEIKRDGQKTRRLWIAIARHLDWLDMDEDFD